MILTLRHSALLLCLFTLWLLAATVAQAQVSVSGWTPPTASGAKQADQAGPESRPLSRTAALLNVSRAPLHRLSAPTASELKQQTPRKKLQVGIIRSLPRPLGALSDGLTLTVEAGRIVLFRVQSDGAVRLRLRFTDFALPAGTRLFVYPAGRPDEIYGPFTQRGPGGDGEFWTPPIAGDELVVEYDLTGQAAELTADRLPFQLPQLSHIFRDAGQLREQYKATGSLDEAGTCQQDVTPDWRETAKSVGIVQFTESEGEFVCSGVLLNTVGNSGTPYVLTASHCIGSYPVARTAETFWLYDQATPGGTPPNTYYSIGATLVATSEVSDFTLLRYRYRAPDGVRYSGWTTAMPAIAESVTGIHHPSGDYKRIASGSVVSSCVGLPPGESCSNYLKVRWNSGATEPGSSGSGLWSGSASDPKLTGILSGGTSACNNRSGIDYYSRFDLIYPAISYYLTGEGCAYSLSHTTQTMAAGGGSGSVSVTAMEGAACNWTAQSDATWLTISSGGTGNGDGTVSFTTAPNPGTQRRFATISVAGYSVLVIQQGAGSGCAAAALSFGQTVSGSLGSGGCRSILDGDVYADRYTFSASAGQQVAISLSNANFDTQLTLFGPTGEKVAQGMSFIGGPNRDYTLNNEFVALRTPGVYTIEVAGTQPGGSYAITLAAGCTLTLPAEPVLTGPFGTYIDPVFSIFSDSARCSITQVAPYPHAPWIIADRIDGNGNVRLTMQANPGPTQRTSVVYVGGLPVYVRQLALCAGSSRPNVSPTDITLDPYGSSVPVNVTMQPGAVCGWIVDTQLSWVSASFPDNDNPYGARIKSGIAELWANLNQTLNARTATVLVGGQPVTVRQNSPASGCNRIALPFDQPVNGSLTTGDCGGFLRDVKADYYTFNGVTSQQVAFEISSPDIPLMVRLYKPDGTLYEPRLHEFIFLPTEPAKNLRAPLQGYINLPDDGVYTLVVTAAEAGASGNYTVRMTGVGGPGCGYQLSSDFQSISADGGIKSFTLMVANGCPWTVTGNADWITFAEGNTGSGSREIRFNVTPNTGAARRALLTVAGRYHSILQSAPCSYMGYEQRDTLQYAGSAGESKTVWFETGPNCPLTVAAPGDWIIIHDKYVGTDGSGRVTFSARTNEGPYRAGQLIINGRAFEIRQLAGNLTVVSSANYGQKIAPGSLVTVFGQELAKRTESATTVPLPDTLGDAYVNVIFVGYGGYRAPLLYVSPTQINFQIPENAPTGPALIEVSREYNQFSRGVMVVEKVAPTVFSADSTGSGLAAALILRLRADGTQSYEPVAQYDPAQQKFVAVPVDLSNSSEQVFLVLFGTGLRGRNALSAVTAQIGGVDAEVLYAGPQGGFVGLDQVNMRLPRSLIRQGQVAVQLTVDGRTANTVQVTIK